MKKFNRLLCAAIAAIMAFAVIGCGDKNNEPDEEENKNPPVTDEVIGTDVFGDVKYEKGFDIYGTGVNGANREIQKTIAFSEGNSPLWSIAQWYSEYFLDKGEVTLNERTFSVADESKSVELNRATGALTLSLDASKEYDGVQGAIGIYWPHLLIQQTAVPVKFADCESMRARLTFRMNRATDCSSKFGSIPISLQAQFAWFVYVRNVNEASDGFGEFLWFGFNLFDPTKLYAPLVSQQDFAGGNAGNYIYAMGAADCIGSERVKIGETAKLDVDMFAAVKKALGVAHNAGFMSHTELEDCAVTGMNIGFEVFDVWDMSATIYEMRVTYTEKNS